MKNSELDSILKGAPVPERQPVFWETFPGWIAKVARARRQEPSDRRQRGGAEPAMRVAFWARALNWRVVGAGMLAAGCLAIGFGLGVRNGQQWRRSRENQVAEAQKCLAEIEPLFPQQLRAIVFDVNGAHLVLAEQADVPASQPVYLKISGPGGERRIVTFSGQRLNVNGQECDVLLDRQGAVLLVGPQWVWSSSEPMAQAAGCRVEARPLRERS